MFQNMRIGFRLTLGFGVVLVLMALVGVIGALQVSRVSEANKVIVDDRWPKTVRANQIIDDINVISRAVRNVLLLEDTRLQEFERQRILQAGARLNDHMDVLEQGLADPENRALLAKLDEARRSFVAGVTKAIDLGRVDRQQAARLLMTEVRNHNGAALQLAEQLIQSQVEAMEEGKLEAEAMAAAARQLILLLSVVALVAAVALAFWITRSITKPLAQAVAAADALAEGDLAARIAHSSRDE